MNVSVLNNFTYGMYAVGVKNEHRTSACIVSSAMLVSNQQPPLVAVSINRSNYSYQCIEKNGLFTLSVLSQNTPAAVVGALGLVSGENSDKLVNIRHRVLVEGVPVIKEDTCCWFLCRVKEKAETGTQALYIAEITAGSDLSEGIPMTYNYYTSQLKGTVPKNAPTYISPDNLPERDGAQKFACSVCGYVFSDTNFGFEELPKDWLCPVCKMPKKVFIRR